MGSSSRDPKEQVILERMLVPKSSGVYWIGRKAIRLTFLSQQQRALNLIWALVKSGKLLKGTSLTIVGAGVGGLTAAYAAARCGANVTLLEGKLVPLHLQRGCQLRFVHPHILDWPAKISETPFTDLPCLNWGAAMAASVCNTILEQWKEIEETIQTFYGYEVREIGQTPEGRPLVFAEGGGANYLESCDCLILAVGFGLESSLPSVPFLSYWENDNFGRALLTGPIPRTYVVSGCGDGGLIDAIRLRINAFDHADFVYMISRIKELKAIKRILPEIDEKIATRLKNDMKIADEVEVRLPKLKERAVEESKARKRVLADIESRLLEEEYRKLIIPPAVVDLLKEQMRKDTIVFLNGPGISPLNLSASVLNRFVVFLLRRFGALRYRAGEVDVIPNQAGHGFRVRFHHDQFPVDELEAHEVVIRHGPISVIDRLFPREIADDCRARPNELADPTRERQYPRDFLIGKDPLLAQRKELVRLQYAITNSPLAAKDRFDASSDDRFGIQFVDGKVSYTLRRLPSNLPPSSPPTPILGIPIHVDSPAGEPIPDAPIPEVQDVQLCFGAAIQNIGQQQTSATHSNRRLKKTGTLGCFVKLRTGDEKGILTTAIGLGDPQIVKVNDRLVRAGAADPLTATVIARISRLILPTPSSPRANVADETIQYNRLEAVFARLVPEVRIDVGFGSAYPDGPRLKFDERITPSGEEASKLVGTRVFKVGGATGLTHGRVYEVLTTATIQAWKDIYHYQGLFSIVGIDGRPFGSIGDGGALVVREDGEVLGLLLGGKGLTSVAIPIETILSALDADLLLPV